MIIYCRVSSDEQVEGTSLDVQEERLTAYCDRKWKVSEYGDDKELEYLMKGFISHDLSEIDISSRHEQWDTEVEIEGEEPLSIPIEIKWHRIPVVNNPFAAQSIEDMMWCILVVDEDRGKFILDPGKYDPNLSDD